MRKPCFAETFPIVRASELSSKDFFMRHKPEGRNQRVLKDNLIIAIEDGLSDFRHPWLDPSVDEYGNIFYKAGSKPGIGHKAEWWEENFQNFMPEKKSRMGCLKEYSAFLALIIKYLIEECGVEINRAWKMVCDESKDIGHYRDSWQSKNKFETTGYRRVGRWADLANTYKIIKDDKDTSFIVAGGVFDNMSWMYPVSDICKLNNNEFHSKLSVGWMVMDV